MVSERSKKLWELTVTDENKSFVFSEFFVSNNINSSSLEHALRRLLDTRGKLNPEGCLYYTSQAETIISRALKRLNIRAIPSKRCFALASLLNERSITTIAMNPGYIPERNSRLTKNKPIVERLPDELKGDKWAFVQLPFIELIRETAKISEGEIFGACPKLKWLSDDIPNDTLIPGLVVYSKRAFPLAAWTNGYELAEISNQAKENCLVIDLGMNRRWLYGRYGSNEAAKREAEEWEKTKKDAKGIHFLAVQPDDDTYSIEGLWIMCNKEG